MKVELASIMIRRLWTTCVASLLAVSAATTSLPAQESPAAQVVAAIDAAVQTRTAGIASYTVLEHYSVFRNDDLKHPAAEMTVRTTYQRESGKSYEILSESGSGLLRKMVLHSILDHEQEINRPGIREGAFFTSANYSMKIEPGAPKLLDSRLCYAVAILPKPKSQQLVSGTLWADAANGQIVQVQGSIRKGLSLFTGKVQVFRKYANIDGFAQAIYARAESNSSLFGRTVVVIDYRDYHISKR